MIEVKLINGPWNGRKLVIGDDDIKIIIDKVDSRIVASSHLSFNPENYICHDNERLKKPIEYIIKQDENGDYFGEMEEIPQNLIEEYASKAKGRKIFGSEIEKLSKEELMALLVFMNEKYNNALEDSIITQRHLFNMSLRLSRMMETAKTINLFPIPGK